MRELGHNLTDIVPGIIEPPAHLELHPIASQGLWWPSLLNVESCDTAIPFLFVGGCTNLVDVPLRDDLGSTVIAMHSVDVVVQFVDVTHPSAVIPFHRHH